MLYTRMPYLLRPAVLTYYHPGEADRQGASALPHREGGRALLT